MVMSVIGGKPDYWDAFTKGLFLTQSRHYGLKYQCNTLRLPRQLGGDAKLTTPAVYAAITEVRIRVCALIRLSR